MKTFLGVDGGGTKTEFVLVDESGQVLARHHEGSAYYLEIGLDALQAILARRGGSLCGEVLWCLYHRDHSRYHAAALHLARELETNVAAIVRAFAQLQLSR